MTQINTIQPIASPDHRGPKFEVNIEGRLNPWPVSTITVDQLRELGNLPGNEPVVEVDLETNDERTLPEHAVVDLKPGLGFGRKVEFKRG